MKVKLLHAPMLDIKSLFKAQKQMSLREITAFAYISRSLEAISKQRNTHLQGMCYISLCVGPGSPQKLLHFIRPSLDATERTIFFLFICIMLLM